MRTIVGVDGTKRYTLALNLLKRFDFQNQSTELVNVVPTVEAYAGMYPAQALIAYEDLAEGLDEAAKHILEDASEESCRRGLPATTKTELGSKAQALCGAADREVADLIAIASGPKNTLDRIFSGCMAQAIAIAAHQSILIARGKEGGTKPLSIVFATDHSPYADRCLGLLLGWQPSGIARATVLTAYDLLGKGEAVTGRHIAVDELKVDEMVRHELAAKTEAAANRFRSAGFEADAQIVRDGVNSAIRQTMKSTEADLLVLGARGHGFWDRLLLGSTAQHQAIAAEFPVLILRPKE